MFLKHIPDFVFNLCLETQIKVCLLVPSPHIVIFIFTATHFRHCDYVCQILNLVPGSFWQTLNNGSVCYANSDTD